MRSRSSIIVLAALTLAFGACTRGGSTSSSPAAPVPRDLLFLSSGGSLSAVDGGTGKVVFSADGAVPAPDWSYLFEASVAVDRTSVRSLDPNTGRVSASTSVPGSLSVATAGPNGEVALVDPASAADPWIPAARSATDITVAHPLSAAPPQRFQLKGNFVPEAFSSDGESLYMLEYLPPMDPVKYRVVSLYLDKGKVWPVYGRDKQPVENMTATRLQQALAPDGTALYTLYTNQPPAYAAGIASEQASSDGEVAFIHTLSLDGGFAECVALPRSFGSLQPAAAALAVSGGRVYAIDAAHGRIAVMDASRLTVIRTAHVDLGAPGTEGTSAGVSADGSTLFVATGTHMTAIDTSTLRPRATTTISGNVTGLGLSPDGGRLYLSWSGHVEALDPSTGTQDAMLSVPGGNVLAHVMAGT